MGTEMSDREGGMGCNSRGHALKDKDTKKKQMEYVQKVFFLLVFLETHMQD